MSVVGRLCAHLRETFCGWSLLPVAIVLNSFLCCSVSYTTAVGDGHLYPVWPLISDTGDARPESCCFSLLLNLSALLLALFAYMRYRLVNHFFSGSSSVMLAAGRRHALHYLNQVAFVCMTAGAFGLSLVANFQETNVAPVHYLGAGLIFGLGSFYMIFESVIGWFTNAKFTNRKIAAIRLACGVGCFLFVILTGVASKISLGIFYSEMPDPDVQYWHWKPGQPGYGWHLTSTFSEWSAAACLMGFLLTMIPDMQFFSFQLHILSERTPDNVPGL